MDKRLHVVSPPPFVKQMADEARASYRASLETALEDIPQRDLARLRQQLTPYAKRICTPDDMREIAKFVQEWGMRSLPGHAPPYVWEMLRDDYSAERKINAVPVRRYYENLLEPWFPPEPKAENPGLRIVGRSSPAPEIPSVWNVKMEALGKGIGVAAVLIPLVDAVFKRDPTKAVEVAGSAAFLHAGTKGLARLIGVRAVPIAGEIVGGAFAGVDAYQAAQRGDTARAAVSGVETALYTVAAVSGAAATFNFWNPVGWSAGAVALVAGGAAVAITAGKSVYDNRHIVAGWFGERSNNALAQEHVSPAYADHPRRGTTGAVPHKSLLNHG